MGPAFRVAAGVAVTTCVLVASGAAPADGAPLSVAPNPVVLDAKGDATVALTNESGIELVTRASVVAEDGSPSAGARAVPRRRVLPPGAIKRVAISGSSRGEAMTLVLVVDPVHEDALPLGAVVRVAVHATNPAKPAVAEWTLRSVLGGSDHGVDLPLDGTCAALGAGAKRATLQADGDAVTVTGSCAAADATSLRLATGSVPWEGRTYKGTLRLGDGEVTLAVAATSSWWIALVLIAVGLGVALVATYWTGWGRDANRLLRETYVVEQLVGDGNERNADRLFQQAAADENLPEGTQRWLIGPSVKLRLAELRRAIRRWRAPEDADRTHMRTRIDELDALVRGWPKLAGRLGELLHRLPRLQELHTYTQSVRTRTLERPSPPGLDDVADVHAAVDEAVALANDWPGDAIAQTRKLAAGLDPKHDAVQALDSVLRQFAAAPDVESAKAALDDFWVADREVHAAVAAVADAAALELMPEAGAATVAGIFSPAEIEDPKAAAGAYALRIFLIDAAVTVVLCAAALVGGMQALWIGKEFAGLWDVVAALVWGLGAGAVVVPLASALGRLGESLLVVGSAR